MPSDIDTFIELLQEELHQKSRHCVDFAATPCSILRSVADSIDSAYQALQERKPKINYVYSPLPPSAREGNDDSVLFCCETCEEEYQLPEGTTQCPVCGDEIEPCQ